MIGPAFVALIWCTIGLSLLLGASGVQRFALRLYRAQPHVQLPFGRGFIATRGYRVAVRLVGAFALSVGLFVLHRIVR